MASKALTVSPKKPLPTSVSSLTAHYREVRQTTEKLCVPLTPEDCIIQSMPDVSPTKWHLAHTSWFFETFLLTDGLPTYRPFHPEYKYLYNSYYNAVGDQFYRPNRGLLSRPSLEHTYRFRNYVDRHVLEFLESRDEDSVRKVAPVITLGLYHEQQHQELILTDIKHVFWCNPLRPVYRNLGTPLDGAPLPQTWARFAENLYWIGHRSDDDCFGYDNEYPRHKAHVRAFEIASRLVTNGEYLEFLSDGGYERPEFWLSDGWNIVNAEGWKAPLYWEQRDNAWWIMTLGGMRKLNPAEPVCHVSFFEADAFARWTGARLPTEVEWEIAAQNVPVQGNLLDDDRLHPVSTQTIKPEGPLSQMFGDVWEWTASPYAPYPGFKQVEGALGEYNAKFMCNQMVLRGGSCATPRSHIRSTYRNFFPPDARWQFMGFRLARDA
ncbi:MAG: ergothioneine biosynthesis protein EgtB [Phycisphaerales bacterium]|nr:ergothioneine biosynthesis protein EgtB [Phycisphaerales bacterium]